MSETEAGRLEEGYHFCQEPPPLCILDPDGRRMAWVLDTHFGERAIECVNGCDVAGVERPEELWCVLLSIEKYRRLQEMTSHEAMTVFDSSDVVTLRRLARDELDAALARLRGRHGNGRS